MCSSDLETVVYNLLDILLIIGFIIAMVGIVFVIVYFVDNNADRTNNILKEFLDSNQINSDVFPRFERSNNSNEGPLKIHRQYDEYNDDDYKELNVEDYQVGARGGRSSRLPRPTSSRTRPGVGARGYARPRRCWYPVLSQTTDRKSVV